MKWDSPEYTNLDISYLEAPSINARKASTPAYLLCHIGYPIHYEIKVVKGYIKTSPTASTIADRHLWVAS